MTACGGAAPAIIADTLWPMPARISAGALSACYAPPALRKMGHLVTADQVEHRFGFHPAQAKHWYRPGQQASTEAPAIAMEHGNVHK